MMFLTDSQVAKRYSVHRCTVWRWMREGLFPKPIKIIGSSRWKLSDLEKWEATR